jgi:type IV secretory pathway VirB3-like protein
VRLRMHGFAHTLPRVFIVISFFCSLCLVRSTWSIFYVSHFRDLNFSDWWCWKFRSSGLSRRCHWWTLSYGPMERKAFIFRFK